MGVTIHYAIGMKSEHVKPALDRTQALAEEMSGSTRSRLQCRSAFDG